MTVETVRIDRIRPADSPRLDGEDPDHIRLLAESDATLPPILVHRESMRVIDGMHRLRVAQLRGDTEVPVEFFDGTELEAFIRAVQLNVTHGLPLSLADRESAAARILESGDSWSDRAIARMTGLSAPTVARIRARSLPDDHAEAQSRIGRDGRVRPLNTTAGRLRAGELIASEPNLSLREIARRAGISVGTARDVRKRLSRGEDPIPARFLPGPHPAPDPAAGPLDPSGPPAADPGPDPMDGSYVSDLNSLQKDPSLRLTGSGRFLLRWLSFHAISQENRASLIRSLPAHNKARIAYMAKCCSRWWAEFANDLEQPQELRDIPKTG
ncbi:ParB/RepB/Spo0J family partition protein [Streptomyces novaecaesareae]|uniref:ParB/RepB/Spo0J family partition protein n=1 Tax=Streptomyces novaecaesareae TaxID=68244 RepID=UPI0004AA81A4|nr:ParB N-terminal domain-containing protein [Streptomyces novaecaesareae]